jgi:hypothetical protein
MKRPTISALLTLLACAPAWTAWQFDEVDDYVLVTDNAALTLPDGDWYIGGWLKQTWPGPGAGDSFKYFLSWGTVGTNNSINFYLSEDDTDTSPGPGNLLASVVDADGTEVAPTTQGGALSNFFEDDTDWHYVSISREGNDVILRIDGTVGATVTNANLDAINVAQDMEIGRRNDGDAIRHFGGDLFAFAKWNRALTSQERTDLLNEANPIKINNPSGPAWVVPMDDDYSESVVPLAVTNNGSTISTSPFRLSRKINPLCGLLCGPVGR